MAPTSLRIFSVLLIALLFAIPPSLAPGPLRMDAGARLPAPTVGPSSLSHRAFAFVSNFEDLKLDGWKTVNGSATVVTSPNYAGEPSLSSTANGTVAQYDRARSGFVRGDPSVSFEVAIEASKGTGYFGLEGASGPVVTVGVRNGSVVAGTTPSTAGVIGSIPKGTAQPAGWVVLYGSIYSVGSGATATSDLDVYTDRTDVALAAAIAVPSARTYLGAFLETTRGTLEYSNIVVTTYRIAQTIPKFNPMEGYGQGSGALVRVLPAFTALSAIETLGNWSTPERSVLSFQINAMNFTGTVRSTCTGFFQLGVDLEPRGRIAPWYVPGHACVPSYFGHKGSWGGFPSPSGTALTLAILDNVSNRTIDFSIVDGSVSGINRTWSASIPYNSTEFFGAYTQLEWQPSSTFPIRQYFLNGSIDHLTMTGGNLSAATTLGADYMLPFAIDAPPSWNLNYYRTTGAGYSQRG